MFSNTVHWIAMAEQGGSAVAPDRRSARALAILLGRVPLALASVVLVVVLLVTAELVARLLAPDYIAQARGPHVFSATYGWASRRQASLMLAGERVTLNERGYRGRSLGLPRTSRLRVVVLGDSIAFGLGVSDDETFSSRLDARENSIEVANLAVQGYGPDQELLVLERDALRLRPDVVVLAFCMANDLAESLLPVSLYDGTTPKPTFRLVQGDLVLDASNLSHGMAWHAQRALADHSHLFNRLMGVAPKPRPPGGRHWRERFADALQQEEQVLAVNRALVRRMSAMCLERGIAFLVVAFPDRFTFRRKTPLLERFFDELERDGIRVLEMAERFRGLGLRLPDVAIDGAGHLSPRGHRVVSEELESEVRVLVASVPASAQRPARPR
jgi:lysophospholipase L1-like esterase